MVKKDKYKWYNFLDSKTTSELLELLESLECVSDIEYISDIILKINIILNDRKNKR